MTWYIIDMVGVGGSNPLAPTNVIYHVGCKVLENFKKPSFAGSFCARNIASPHEHRCMKRWLQ